MDVTAGRGDPERAGRHVRRRRTRPELPVTEIRLQRDEHADSVVDLLGMVAYGRLSGFFRLTDDAAAAASLPDKIALAEMAVAEYGRFRQVLRRLEELDADPAAAMQPFMQAVDAFHAQTRPADWLEGLVKTYVGDGISADFYRTIADLLDPETRALVNDVLADTSHSDFVIGRVRAAIVADPSVAGRLALWARRLVGEAVGQAQRIAAEREPLARLLGGGDSSQLSKIGRMFSKFTDAHFGRMVALGLARRTAPGSIRAPSALRGGSLGRGRRAQARQDDATGVDG